MEENQTPSCTQDRKRPRLQSPDVKPLESTEAIGTPPGSEKKTQASAPPIVDQDVHQADLIEKEEQQRRNSASAQGDTGPPESIRLKTRQLFTKALENEKLAESIEMEIYRDAQNMVKMLRILPLSPLLFGR
eukprot:m.139860 g.139860  ORF g.139860 m.139860 type:complete len:132 (-) comp14813_c0_seq14:766-1161(-)